MSSNVMVNHTEFGPASFCKRELRLDGGAESWRCHACLHRSLPPSRPSRVFDRRPSERASEDGVSGVEWMGRHKRRDNGAIKTAAAGIITMMMIGTSRRSPTSTSYLATAMLCTNFAIMYDELWSAASHMPHFLSILKQKSRSRVRQSLHALLFITATLKLV